jgi:uncharacterized membrane protein YadS
MEESPKSPPSEQDHAAAEKSGLVRTDDCWAIWVGGGLLLVTLVSVLVWRMNHPSEFADAADRIDALGERIKASRKEAMRLEALQPNGDALLEARMALNQSQGEMADLQLSVNPLAPLAAKPGGWYDNPLEAFYIAASRNVLPGMLGVFLVALFAFGLGQHVMGTSFGRFARAFPIVFLLATLSYVLAGQDVIRYYNLEYALWALLVGLVISNTVGTPNWLKAAVCTEFYIKTGLVLLGAEILLSLLLSLGVPGICVAWIVTPIVLVTTFWFGQRVLKIESPSLNMVISADMSVCGVSAAIATAAACRAKKEELSLAIGLSLTFTVIMMVAMPWLIRAVGMNHVLGGAWIGGTIDATGAVAAAGELLGETALSVAATVKMIQNILIGVIAFGVAVYWVNRVERGAEDIRPSAAEIWRRFPKFVLGFLAASIVFSTVYSAVEDGDVIVNGVIDGTTGTYRGWFFCLAFVSIGLDTDFRELAAYLRGGKPLVLYLCGQSLNLCLTLAMAWLMFEVVFADQVAQMFGGS